MPPRQILLLCLSAWTGEAGELAFNRDIRPILSENCFYCHGQDGNKREGDLRLDDRAAAIGMKAIVPGDIETSELIKRILTDDAEEIMPPPAAKQELTAAQKETLRLWVKSGAEYRDHWAFTAPKRPPVPSVTPAAVEPEEETV